MKFENTFPDKTNQEQSSIVRDALPSLREFAQMEVPAGLILHWGEALNWPSWMYEGTSLDPSLLIPRRIPITDDYTIVARFLDRFGPCRLLESYLTDIHAMPDIDTIRSLMAAPNLAACLHYCTKASNTRNPHFKVTISETHGGISLKISSFLDIGRVDIFVEHIAILMFLRIFSIFQPRLRITELGQGSMPKLGLRDASPEIVQSIHKITGLEVGTGDQETSIFVPDSALEHANPRQDPDIWGGLYMQLRKNWFDDTSPFSISTIRLHVRQSLKIRHRIPNLDEFAHDLAISKRTLSRKLAMLGISYQELVLEERMSGARELLSDASLPVERVAASLGYGGSAAFGRAFRKHFGVSPSEWRSQTLNTD